MSKDIERRLNSTPGDRVFSTLETMIKRNTELFQYVVGVVFSGLAIRFGLNIEKLQFSPSFYTQLFVYILLLITYLIFILLAHLNKNLENSSSLNNKTNYQIDMMQTNFVNWLEKKSQTMTNPEHVARLYELGNKMFNLMTLEQVDKRFAKGIMVINDAMYNTYKALTKPIAQGLPTPAQQKSKPVETVEETEAHFDTALVDDPPNLDLPTPKLVPEEINNEL